MPLSLAVSAASVAWLVVVKVWEDADKAGFFRAFLAARDLWVWQKNYCPVKDSPDAGDETPPTALVPA